MRSSMSADIRCSLGGDLECNLIYKPLLIVVGQREPIGLPSQLSAPHGKPWLFRIAVFDFGTVDLPYRILLRREHQPDD